MTIKPDTFAGWKERVLNLGSKQSCKSRKARHKLEIATTKKMYQKSCDFPWRILCPWKRASLDELLRSNAWPEWMGENETSPGNLAQGNFVVREGWEVLLQTIQMNHIKYYFIKKNYHILSLIFFMSLPKECHKCYLHRFINWIPRLTSETSTWTAAQQGEGKDVPLGQCSPHPPFADVNGRKNPMFPNWKGCCFFNHLQYPTGPYT